MSSDFFPALSGQSGTSINVNMNNTWDNGGTAG